MPPAPDDDRLAALERAVLDLRRDVHDLRTTLAESRAALPAPAAPAAPAGAPAASPIDRLVRLPPAPLAPGLGERAVAYARAQAAGLGVRPGPDGAAPDLEAVVGRYGTVAVAALLILMAAGAFLTWAVANFDLTPAARVGLGGVAAAALAALGGWLRHRASAPGDAATDAAERAGSRGFGDVLLALALAVTHVEAWAAGPYLHLVPPAATLAVAAVASAGLAALAWRARQQSLFLVGVGGALAAPFVTGSAADHPAALRIYGWMVLASALLAIPAAAADRERWRGAFRLLGLGGVTYTAAHFGGPLAMAAVGNPAGLTLPGWMLERHVPVLFALASALVPLALAARPQRVASDRAAEPDAGVPLARLALVYLTAGAGALLALAIGGSGATWWILGLALAATGLVYVALRPLTGLAPAPGDRRRWLLTRLTPAATAVTHPLVLLAAALAGLPRVVGTPGAATAALWTALSGTAALATWHAPPGERMVASGHTALTAAHAAAAGLASALVPVLLFSPHDVVRVTALGVLAGLSAQLLRRVQHPLILLAPAVVGGSAAAWAWTLLDARPAYAYTPFLTPESLAAAAVVAGWAALAVRIWRDGTEVFPTGERRFVVGLAIAVALGWGRQELAHAVAPDMATVLLIGYFALAGIGSIALGRARRAPAARQIGLGLALYAAAKALLQASQLEAVGLRVLSYLVVGGFFLGIAYWYRAAGASQPVERHPDATPAI